MADVHTPSVMWAQRPNLVFVTINVSDCIEPNIKVEKDSLAFKGVGGADKKNYELLLKFHGEVNKDTVKLAVRPRCIELALERIEGPYWPRLLENKTKQHWLKVDFSKWKEEDDSDAEEGAGGQDLEEMMKNMGGLGGGGGMGGMDMSALNGMGGAQPNMDDLEDDSDDEDLPGLE